MHFESSNLWQRTFGSTRSENRYERERLKLSYLATRNTATALLGELSHSTPHFTVHDITHVDALWETASMLCGASVTLTPAEAYVLGCSFILHDAAMGASGYRESIPSTIGMSRWHDLLSSFIVNETGKWPTAAELACPDEEITKACTLHAIRELHAAHAAKLVEQSWTTSAGNELYLIEDLQLRESYGPLIGDLAASHWWSVDRLESHFRRGRGSLPSQPAEWIVDPLKLAAILRLADAIQIDSRRAPTFLFALRRPEGNSREHWRFQEHIARPQLIGDRVTFTAWRPFETHDTDAWWLALDYLRSVDNELKKVDALLHDLQRPRFEGRAVAGVDSPERFAELFPVRGWRPVDARIAVSDVPRLVESLGGEQLYGSDNPEVGLRELLQNAQDAVMARKSLDPNFTDDEITVTLTEQDSTWTLEVTDHGVGMDEDILTTALLDFGRTGWTTATVRHKFVGLADGGFCPKGRFGIGFFSVFMLGDAVEIVSRRFDASLDEARRLRFRGVRARPILTPVNGDERTPVGTTVRVQLRLSPYDATGLFSKTSDDRLDELIRWLCPEHLFPIRTLESNRSLSVVLPPEDLRSTPPEMVFDILYPRVDAGGTLGEMQRQNLREKFTECATEVVNEKGERIGVAAFGEDWFYSSSRLIRGTVLVGGFRADEYTSFVGYMDGRPSRASRDRVELDVKPDELRDWVNLHEKRLRELGILASSTQVGLAYFLYLANHSVPSDYAIALSADGILKISDLSGWVTGRDEIILVRGWPLSFRTRPVRAFNMLSGHEVALPEDWLYPNPSFYQAPFTVFDHPFDAEYESARRDHTDSWQKVWWRMSSTISGMVLKLVCEAWNCEIGDVLAPVEKRGWRDFAEIAGVDIGPIPVYRIQRPTNRD